ncbi:MAG: ribosome maturation factor RimP [Acidimicrobiia bacterium]|nr:ribosome maturation factor RimP [Acidimicrobiia bacterium]
MTTAERVQILVEPLLAGLGIEVVDLEVGGGVVRLTVDRPAAPRGPDGGSPVDMAAIALATRTVSRALDEADPIDGAYTLEVSSPGLERTLRTPAHFARAVGAVIAVKTKAHTEGDRRVKGRLVGADTETVTVDIDGAERAIRIDDIEKARTVFEWGPGPKPGKAPAGTRTPATSPSSARPGTEGREP